MQQTQLPTPTIARIGRAVGDVVTIGINLAVLYVVRHVVEWGWPGFITVEFDVVEPWISASLLATVVASLVYLVADEPIIRRMGGVVVGIVSLLATIRLWQVYPFDFSSYDFPWSTVTTVVLALAVFGTGVGIVKDLTGVLTGAASEEKGEVHAGLD